VDISSEDARTIQFSGTDSAYDGVEVEEFRRRVVATLAAYEAASTTSSVSDEGALAEAQRVRRQAVTLAERMLRDVMSASGDSTSGFTALQEAAMLQAVAEEEMAFSTEEAKRLVAIATAERDAIRAKYAHERRELRAELQKELQASRDAAATEAESIVASGREEATHIVEKAVARQSEVQHASADESQRLERRLSLLRTTVADAEARFRRLAATAANDLGTLSTVLDEEESTEPMQPQERQGRPEFWLASIDLTDTAPEGGDLTPVEDEPEPGLIPRDPEVGFYQRRLAGLRDRLEKSGNPPD